MCIIHGLAKIKKRREGGKEEVKKGRKGEASNLNLSMALLLISYETLTNYLIPSFLISSLDMIIPIYHSSQVAKI